MTLRPVLSPILLFGFLAGCAGVETGAVSPCHGQFRAQGKYFAAKATADGSTVVVSTMNAPQPGCRN